MKRSAFAKRTVKLLACVLAYSAMAVLVGCAAATAAEYVELSHLVEAQMPVDPALKLPEMEFFGRIGENGGKHNLEVISYCPHTGTHMDSPFHVIPDKPTVESWPADVLIGPAAIIAVGAPGAYEVKKEDITAWEEKNGAIEPGEAVMFHTGHDANWEKGYDAYIKDGYPTISLEAAQYLVEKKIRFVAVESISPEGDSTEIHQTFMKNGIPVVENICNLAAVGSARCDTVGTFAAVKGATGVWVRILATAR